MAHRRAGTSTSDVTPRQAPRTVAGASAIEVRWSRARCRCKWSESPGAAKADAHHAARDRTRDSRETVRQDSAIDVTTRTALTFALGSCHPRASYQQYEARQGAADSLQPG